MKHFMALLRVENRSLFNYQQQLAKECLIIHVYVNSLEEKGEGRESYKVLKKALPRQPVAFHF